MANISRRKIVTALGVGATVSLAGCNGNSNTDGSDGSDGSDETDSSDGSNGSDGEDISVEDLPEGFSETGVEDLQTALGSDSAFYDQTVIETEFTITQGSATVENYHYANHDEKLLFQEQVVPSRTRQNYYTDGTYYVYTSAEGVDPQYNVEDVEWQRSVMYYFPPTNLLASGEFTLEQTEEGFRYVTEDTENAEFMGQVSQLVQSSQSGGDSETDPVSEFSAELPLLAKEFQQDLIIQLLQSLVQKKMETQRIPMKL